MAGKAPGDGSELTDIELVDRLLRGERGAFDIFYRRHEKLIYHCIRARTPPGDVPDLFQGFFERLIDRDYHILKLWQRGTSLPIYLSKVVRNFVIDFHRAKRWREESVGGLTELEPLGSSADETATTTLLLKEVRRKGIEAWAKLDPRERVLICGKFCRDSSNEAMAAKLGMSIGALRTALSRAQAKFLATLQNLVPEYFPVRV